MSAGDVSVTDVEVEDSPMKETVYRIQYVGGPSDGLLDTVQTFDRHIRLRMAAVPIVVRRPRTHCYELIGHRCATYEFAGENSLVETGRRTIHCRYEFVGYESSHPNISRPKRSWPRSLKSLGSWLSRLRGQLVNWLLAPVEHPLTVSPPTTTMSGNNVTSPSGQHCLGDR
jgi:hypothetical protein